MSYAGDRKKGGAVMKNLLELMAGFFFGSFVAFTVFGAFFERDLLQEEISRRSKQAQCETYEEWLMSSQSPEDKMHLSKIYANLCEEAP